MSAGDGPWTEQLRERKLNHSTKLDWGPGGGLMSLASTEKPGKSRKKGGEGGSGVALGDYGGFAHTLRRTAPHQWVQRGGRKGKGRWWWRLRIKKINR